jgi:aspartyl-tRNA(Asn)/glutamyl-tRNA(Gln) amidotransferase subunit A
MNDVATMTIHELAPLIQRREVSPVEVTRDALERIAALDARLHSFITIRAERALDDARAAEEEVARGNYRGPFHGIPLGIKDNIAVAGWPATNGSALMTDNIPDYDATVVERLRQAGAVIVGKNNMHEWAMGSTCDGPFGTVHNPWDESRVSGGSSGGSAAAVSASLIYGSVGTDGMGSIRMPSCYCGVVGLKPTFGLVSRFGELPPTSSTSDHLGPIVKDVTDAAMMLNVLAGADSRDPTSIPSAPTDYTADLGRGVAGLRIGVPQNFFFDRAIPPVRDAVHRAIEVLVSLGATTREVQMPSLAYMHLITPAQVGESRAFLLPFALRGPQSFTDQSIWERTIVGEFTRTADMAKAARLRSLIRQEFLAAMEQVDLLAMPTTVSPAFPIDYQNALPAAFTEANLGTTLLTFPFNMVGTPAISVPCGFAPDGLPIGLMLAGRHWEDALVLRAAYAYEQAGTGGYTVPPIAAVRERS